MTEKHFFSPKRIFWILFFLGLAIRIYRFGALPYGANQDEAMGAVDAWALSLYGTDRFGVRLPVHFSAWQVSQMSVLLSYLMIPFIKLFGFSTTVIRLPMLFASLGGIVLMYLTGRKLFGETFGLLAMFLTVINPWHFMQSRWSIDCNLFPHVFLLAFYLLLLGIEKRRYLYLSMFFFGMTFYCYGIAVYSVTAFLAVFALWGLWKKIFSVKEVLISVGIFGLTALPEILVMAINLFHLETIETGWITMSRFPQSVRGNDILFLNFSLGQLVRNIWAMLRCAFLQLPDHWFNAIPAFGPMYHISIPFMAAGAVWLTAHLWKALGSEKKEEEEEAAKLLALWGFLLTGIWVGIITYEVNVNRINIIFYPLIFVTAYALCKLGEKYRKLLAAALIGFAGCGIAFVIAYFTVYPKEAAKYYNGTFLEAVKELDGGDAEKLYITGNMGWQFNLSMAEILTQYACHIDARYYQGLTDETGGRKLLPYSERYHYINAKENDFAYRSPEALYLVHEQDLQYIPCDNLSGYTVRDQIGDFYILELYYDMDD